MTIYIHENIIFSVRLLHINIYMYVYIMTEKYIFMKISLCQSGPWPTLAFLGYFFYSFFSTGPVF